MLLAMGVACSTDNGATQFHLPYNPPHPVALGRAQAPVDMDNDSALHRHQRAVGRPVQTTKLRGAVIGGTNKRLSRATPVLSYSPPVLDSGG